MQRMRLFLSTSVAALALVASASPARAGGLCGARDKPWMRSIPDSLNAGMICAVAGGATIVSAGKSADFGRGCTHHDLCYWTLGADRGACDDTFRGELRDACRRAYHTLIDEPAKGCCLGIADVYAAAVRSGGKGSYEDGQRDAAEAAALYAQQGGYAHDATLVDMIAHFCFDAVAGERCDTAKVAARLAAVQRSIEATFEDHLEQPLGEAEFRELLAAYWASGESLEPVRAKIVERHGPEIVRAQTWKLAGVEPDAAVAAELLGVLRSFGLDSLRHQAALRYAKAVVARVFTEVTGKPVPFYWALYYERLLIQTRDVAALREAIARQHVRR